MSENVVEFPSHRIVREHAGIQVIEDAREKSIQKFADTITEDLIGYMAEELENSGIDIERPEFLKDFSLTVDSLRAAIYRQFDIPHNLHAFVDTNVKMVNRSTGQPILEEEIDITQ
jgi:hypothetical protein